MKKHFYTQTILDICDHHHLTVDEIFVELQKTHPAAGRSTVYRNVEQMAQEWLLCKLTGFGEKALFERNIGPHAHLFCAETKTLTDVILPSSIDLSLLVPQGHSLTNIDIRLMTRPNA